MQCRSLIKDYLLNQTITYWEENPEYITALEDIFDSRRIEIVESVLDKNSELVTPTIAKI